MKLMPTILILVHVCVLVCCRATQLDRFDLSTESPKYYCRKNSECPTMFTCDSNNECVCRNERFDGITCDNRHMTSWVIICYCVTYDEKSLSTFAGHCFYNCRNQHSNESNRLIITAQLPK